MVVICENQNNLMLAFSQQIITYDNDTKLLRQHAIAGSSVENTVSNNQTQLINNQLKNITCMATSSDGLYTACTTENKQLIVLDTNFSTIRFVCTPRTVNKICFSPENHVIVADKTGDVLMYKLNEKTNIPIVLLGHLSIIFDIVISKCGKYIITCDRDEKIRITRYPNTYNIVSYCLGHTEFVSSLKLLENDILLSAGGDGTIRMWNYLEGEQLKKIDTCNLVEQCTLDEFIAQMDDRKISVKTLPIIDMQIGRQDGASVTLAIQMSRVKKIHLFTLNVDTLDSKYFTNIDVDTTQFKYLIKDMIYVVSSKITVYQIDGNRLIKIVEDLCDQCLKDLFQRNNNDDNDDDDACVLYYKKKFDNMQNYYDKKKRRLEIDIN